MLHSRHLQCPKSFKLHLFTCTLAQNACSTLASPCNAVILVALLLGQKTNLSRGPPATASNAKLICKLKTCSVPEMNAFLNTCILQKCSYPFRVTRSSTDAKRIMTQIKGVTESKGCSDGCIPSTLMTTAATAAAPGWLRHPRKDHSAAEWSDILFKPEAHSLHAWATKHSQVYTHASSHDAEPWRSHTKINAQNTN